MSNLREVYGQYKNIIKSALNNKIALCVIAKNENAYLPEFIDYYLNLGFDKIYIYENNDIEGGENIADVVQNPLVEIIDYRGKKKCQMEAYQDCYDKHGKDFRWIAYFDVDEFLTLVNHTNIKDFLNQECFNDYDLMHINWMVYDDNDQIYYEDKPVLTRFTRPIPFNTKKGYDFPENNHIKTILRGGLDNINWKNSWNPHTPLNKELRCCNPCAIKCASDSPFNDYNFDSAYIKHFTQKSLEEYINKMKRGYFADAYKHQRSKIDNFFLLNKKTPEKLEYIKKTLGN